VDEQPDEARGLVEVTAAVAAQVEDDALDLLLLELADQARDVAGRRAVVLVAADLGLVVGRSSARR
jgi:hypothetical protein